eukprot:scpid76622/ scgid8805/ 
MALPGIRRRTSPMPIGRTPGFLSKGISRQARYASRDAGSTNVVASRRAQVAIASQSSPEAPPNPVHMRLQVSASTPDGPAAPCVFRATRRTTFPVNDSKSDRMWSWRQNPLNNSVRMGGFRRRMLGSQNIPNSYAIDSIVQVQNTASVVLFQLCEGRPELPSVI